MADASGFRFAIQKLNSENYPIWSYKVELLLIRDKLWSVIKDSAPSPITEEWSDKDDQARAAIGLLVEDNQLLHIRSAKSAKEAWETLKNYHQKVTAAGIVHTMKKLCRLVMKDGDDMEQHIALLTSYIDSLAALGEKISDKIQAGFLLSSLPVSYDTLITALEGRLEKDITPDFVKGKLIDEYKRRKEVKLIRGEVSGDAALKVAHKEIHKDSSVKSKKQCFFCKKSGHYKSECTKYKSWKSKQDSAKKVTENTIQSSSNEFCYLATSVKESEKIPEAACLGANTTDKDLWFVDSGATSHMVNSLEFFQQLDPKRRGHVRLADDNKLAEIKGVGFGIINCIVEGNSTGMTVRDVLYVPSLSSNLLSVKKLAKDGYKIIFENDDCFIEKGGVLHAAAKLTPDLYEVMIAERACTANAVIKMRHADNCQQEWHRRFGHRDLSAIKDLESKGLATGIAIKDCGVNETCESCLKGKMSRMPFPKEAKNRARKILDLVHTDVCGPMQTETPRKKRYILTIIDDFSRYTTVYFLQYKNEAAMYIKNFIELMKTQLHKRVKMIRSDLGREYINDELQGYLRAEGIKEQHSAAHSPQQNGVAERKNRSLLEMSRCMLIDANLDKKYWAEAVNTANFLQNRLPTKAAAKTPYELWTGQKPDVKNLHIFGSEAYVFVHKEQRKKLDDKAQKFIFVGYSEESKAYRFLDTKTDRIKISRDVVFVKEQKKDYPNSTYGEVEFSSNKDKNHTIQGRDQDNFIEISEESSSDESESFDDACSSQSESEQNGVQCEQPRRSERTNKGVPPNRYTDTTWLAKAEQSEPRSFQEALSSPHKDEWKGAINEELDSLQNNGTWEIVPRPTDRDAITCKWVFKVKRNAEGNIERYKARLVARGFSQKYGIDYDEVFAPVVRQTTFRTLLVVAGQKRMTIKHFDAKTAFLNGDLEETIFMEIPEGIDANNKADFVCKLKKGIYGLKQAAKVWHDKLHTILRKLGFVQSNADPCLYIKKEKGEVIYLTLYVDDFLICAKTEEKINQIAGFLREHFQLADLGILQHYLGIEVRKDKEGIFFIKQTKYIEKILKRFGLEDAKSSSVPLDPGYVKIREDESLMPKNEKYQQLIGALLYLAVNTRPDIAASVTILSQHNKQPTTVDWNEAKRVARYLKGTKDYELRLGQRRSSEGLTGYADADWAENRSDRKSNSGYVFQYYGASVSWGCRKQSCVSLSSTEAEYVALAEASQEGIWIRR